MASENEAMQVSSDTDPDDPKTDVVPSVSRDISGESDEDIDSGDDQSESEVSLSIKHYK